jgi:Activator of Hsp90 ATPase homolog 1-like protein
MLASRADVWRFLEEPYHFADWWPTVSAVRPDARGFREGARWEVAGPASPTLFRKGGATGLAIVKTIELHERVVWNLSVDRLDVEVRLAAVEPDRTVVTVAVEGPWRPEALGRPRALPRVAVHRLYELLQTAASLDAGAASA